MLLKYPNACKKTYENYNDMYVILPFYKSLYDIKPFVVEYIQTEALKSNNPDFKQIINSMNLKVSFRKVNSLESYCKMRKS